MLITLKDYKKYQRNADSLSAIIKKKISISDIKSIVVAKYAM